MSSTLDIEPMSSYLDIVRNDVRELRAARSLSQAELAQALDVSRQTIISIEKGRYVPSLPLALALARFFGKPVEEVFHADDC
jgi:putative transcriptional regulator